MRDPHPEAFDEELDTLERKEIESTLREAYRPLTQADTGELIPEEKELPQSCFDCCDQRQDQCSDLEYDDRPCVKKEKRCQGRK